MAGRETLVVAGRSARLLAEAAARDGFEVIALDAFGDLDTRRAARRWQAIGSDGSTRLDPTRTLAALEAAAREPGVIGWVAGSDFECELDLLEQGTLRLPLFGCQPHAVRRVRDPRVFFGVLDELGLPHPETRFDAPPDAGGWLRKDARGSGGWHIRRAAEAPPPDPPREPYFQREAAGRPMSALFIADDNAARLIGINELIVRPLGAHPHVYRGAIGPVALPAAPAASLEAMLDALAAAFVLRGLGSLDFVFDGQRLDLLEINPRPPASLALYAGQQPLLRAHVEVCRGGALPPAAEADDALVRGSEIVFSRHAFRLSPPQAAMLADAGDCHDLPAAGSAFAAGDPVCSISALGQHADAVRVALAARRQALRDGWTARPLT